ncbi:zf-DHHC-domain-containing protein [Rickenella mellea]|uniref:Palmitoyltransferase n=1 Tax=Rickenella mellea TaxID=50990 RepID=A0A4Y7Q4Q2_9AGAM|nr:zf-DHHC-domain-containing protein [Rickenella mellea]
MPLVSLDIQDQLPPYTKSMNDDEDAPRRRWWHGLPICLTISLILSPHPSVIYTLTTYYLQLLHSPWRFAQHIIIIYALTFLAFSSLMVCAIRDPGPVSSPKDVQGDEEGLNAETSLTEALIAPPEDEYGAPGKWCRKCWAPKPERTHHCSLCGRCVLKMDHHCPWIGSKCVGHWTYPAFLHFLLSVTLLSLYIFLVFSRIVWIAFVDPFLIDETTAIHALFLAVMGAVFTLSIGSFFLYHVYLTSTNQTTLESLSPFLLLRYLPPLPQPPDSPSQRAIRLSDPPEEHELSSSQRRHVRKAHSKVHMYDVGWRRNWLQVVGCKRRKHWIIRALYGGGGCGDGKSFPRNPRAEQMLSRLASKLVDEDKLR